jgi:hypothetical protein
MRKRIKVKGERKKKFRVQDTWCRVQRRRKEGHPSSILQKFNHEIIPILIIIRANY